MMTAHAGTFVSDWSYKKVAGIHLISVLYDFRVTSFSSLQQKRTDAHYTLCTQQFSAGNRPFNADCDAARLGDNADPPTPLPIP